VQLRSNLWVRTHSLAQVVLNMRYPCAMDPATWKIVLISHREWFAALMGVCECCRGSFLAEHRNTDGIPKRAGFTARLAEPFILCPHWSWAGPIVLKEELDQRNRIDRSFTFPHGFIIADGALPRRPARTGDAGALGPVCHQQQRLW
jgi:hypothetical protein